MKLNAVVHLFLAASHHGYVYAAHPKVVLNEDPVHESYIVVLRKKEVDNPPGVASNQNDELSSSQVKIEAEALTAFTNVQVTAIYEKAFQGFVAKMTLEEAEAMAVSDNVAYIEQDGKIYAPSIDASLDSSTTMDSVNMDSSVNMAKISWGLDRIDQEKLPLNRSYLPPGKGKGVTAYIIDSGIRTSHSEFENRASNGVNTSGDGKDDDCDGHGTHVAGTVAGKRYGVAYQANVVAVKVYGCDGSGTVSTFIAGVEWIMKNVKKPATVNASLSTKKTKVMNTAVNNLHNSGVPTVVAAGNDKTNACKFSPASATDVITVGATTETDARWSDSNWGTCIDIMAPGAGIKSAGHDSDTSLTTKSGTSMASPHVCGAVALLLEKGISASNVRSELISMATSDTLTKLKSGTPNKLLHVHWCLQSTAFFKFGGKKRTCKSVIQKKNDLCKKEYILSYCPSTCDACEEWGYADADENVPFYSSKKGPAWTCQLLQKLKKKKKKKYCQRDKFYSTCRVTCSDLINFDDLDIKDPQYPEAYYHSDIQLSNFYAVRVGSDRYYDTGYEYGTISQPNVGFNGWGEPMTMSCPAGSFNLKSLFMTPAFYDDGLIATFDGYSNGSLKVSKTVTLANSEQPTFLESELSTLTDLDTLVISTAVQKGRENTHVAVDDINIEITSPCNVVNPRDGSEVKDVSGLAGF